MDVESALGPKPVLSRLLLTVVLLAACSTSEEQPAAPSTVAERSTVTTTAPDTTAEASTTTTAPPSTTSPELTVEFTLVTDPAHRYPVPATSVPTPGTVDICPNSESNPECYVPLTWLGDWQVASGALSGLVTVAVYFVGLHAGSFEPVELLWFEGTVAGCGTGGVAIREAVRHQPDGSAEPGWEVVPGLGVGDLATLTGHGTVNGFPGGAHTGVIQCRGGADTAVFSSTLLGPAAESGIDVAVPAHSPTSITEYPIEPHPAQTDPPDMWVSEVDYEQWTSTMLHLGVRFPETSTTPVRNTMVSIFAADDSSVLFADLDCRPSPVVGRTFLDDALYPEFRGAWDLLTSGIRGGGTYDADTNQGRVRCGT